MLKTLNKITEYFDSKLCIPYFFGLNLNDLSVQEGIKIPEHDPEECDLLVVVGVVTHKKLPFLMDIYAQMKEPKWVVLLGTDACSGGIYYNSYSIIKDLAEYIPVDYYIPGGISLKKDLSVLLENLKSRKGILGISF